MPTGSASSTSNVPSPARGPSPGCLFPQDVGAQLVPHHPFHLQARAVIQIPRRNDSLRSTSAQSRARLRAASSELKPQSPESRSTPVKLCPVLRPRRRPSATSVTDGPPPHGQTAPAGGTGLLPADGPKRPTVAGSSVFCHAEEVAALGDLFGESGVCGDATGAAPWAGRRQVHQERVLSRFELN